MLVIELASKGDLKELLHSMKLELMYGILGFGDKINVYCEFGKCAISRHWLIVNTIKFYKVTALVFNISYFFLNFTAVEEQCLAGLGQPNSSFSFHSRLLLA